MDQNTFAHEQESIVSLLREINLSLNTIKNQSRVIENSKPDCTCQRPAEVQSSSQRTGFNKYSIAERSAPYGLYTRSTESSDATRFEDWEDSVDLDLIAYGESSPLDDFTLEKFALKYDCVSEMPEIYDYIRCLPPDDYRHQIPATRGAFLRRLMQDTSYSDSPAKRNLQLFREKLGRFQEFKIKLGTGHFWIRDYDLSGSYIHWDCVKPPAVSSVDKSIREKQCKIPDSKWPSNWLFQDKKTPIAPWRRIMYVQIN